MILKIRSRRNRLHRKEEKAMAEVKAGAPTAETSVVPSATPVNAATRKAPGLSFRRFFTKAGVSPYDEIEWELRTRPDHRRQGQRHLRAERCRSPQRLVDDCHQHRGQQISARHRSARPSARPASASWSTRVAETIRDWGMAQGYFRTPEDGATFHDELAHILLRQYAAFNSPVWFNVGCDRIEPNSDAQNWHWNPPAQRVEFGVTGYKHAAVLGLLHQLGEGFARLHPHPGQDRRHALQVGIGHRHQSLSAALLDRKLSAAAAPPAVRSAS